MIKHAVKCKKFPDPFDERDPAGPCTCGAEERTTDPCVHQYEYVSLGGQMQHWVCNKCGAIGYGSPGNIEASGRYIQKRTYAVVQNPPVTAPMNSQSHPGVNRTVDETTAGPTRCPVHWTYENGLRIRCKKAIGHSGECDLK